MIYHEWAPWAVSVFGVEVLDRDDISLLPVAGIVWRPRRDLVLELVFPRPKLQIQLESQRALYVNAELGGDTWAIQRVDRTSDNVTYRDIRIMGGIIDYGEQSDRVLEFGWAFDRSLEYRSGAGDPSLDASFLLRGRINF